MSETTNISWATSTGNPWIGCSKVSPGCKNCYAAELDANRFSKTMGGGTSDKPESHWGKGAPRIRTKAFWRDALKWNAVAAKAGYDGRAHSRPRIFPSLCDWLDDEVPTDWLADFLKLIHDTPNLDWLLLTKRPENFLRDGVNCSRIEKACALLKHPARTWLHQWFHSFTIPHNVWIGASVEDQKRADERIPLLLQIPAKVRFLSVEPLLEQINLHRWFCFHAHKDHPEHRYSTWCDPSNSISWVIVGGESGSGRRDCGVGAICDIARQCIAAGVPCHIKQDSAFKPGRKGRIPDDVWALKQFPAP